MEEDSENEMVLVRSPLDIWQKHPSFLLCEIIVCFLALLTLIHAVRHGGRYIFLWFTIILHGLVVESISYMLLDIDNFWHAQSSVMLLGARLPIHIIVIYPVFIYTASVAVARMNLSLIARACAVGIGVVLIDVPFDIMGIKLLWWTWHDTDPNIYDRHYWVPWTSYYFHASFASSFTFLFHGTRNLFTRESGFQLDGLHKELFCSLIAGLFGMPLGILQFIPLYHPLHDGHKIHTEVCVGIVLMVYVLIIWSADRHPTREARHHQPGFLDEIGAVILLHFSFYVGLVFFAKPENIRSTGLHEPVGDCSAKSSIMSAFGQVLPKRKYLCVSDYDEGYFDFHCLAGSKPPPNDSVWYTVCGNGYPNHLEYKIVVCAFCFLGLVIYYQILKNSGRQERMTRIKSRSKRD